MGGPMGVAEWVEWLAKGYWHGLPAGLVGWGRLAFEAGATWADVRVQRVDWPERCLGVRRWRAAARAA